MQTDKMHQWLVVGTAALLAQFKSPCLKESGATVVNLTPADMKGRA